LQSLNAKDFCLIQKELFEAGGKGSSPSAGKSLETKGKANQESDSRVLAIRFLKQIEEEKLEASSLNGELVF